MKTHKDLDAWKDGIELVVILYQETKSFPKEEIYGLRNQIRRAVISIPSNISEGAARNYPSEFGRFLRISQGSLAEVETLIYISKRLNYIDAERFSFIQGKIFKINAQLAGLIKFIRK